MQTIKTKLQPTNPPPPFQHTYKNIAKNILNKEEEKSRQFLSIYIFLLAIGIDFEGTKRTKVEPISERTIKKRICLGQR